MTNRINLRLIAFVLIAIPMMTLTAADDPPKPLWWFGGGLGGNYNIFDASLRSLNATTTAPAAFTNGSGLGFFGGLLLEYRPGSMWGGTLNIAFDGRGGSFDDLPQPSGTHKLSTTLNYISIEPTVRVNPWMSGLHFFAGPRLAFNVSGSFTYEQPGQPTRQADWSNVRGTILGGLAGVGYDIPLTKPEATWQMELTPFASVHVGQGPRSSESWSLTSIRAGVALKFGSTTEAVRRVEETVAFTVRAPGIIPRERKVMETFPLRNDIFFERGSTAIPSRYVQLTRERAASFSEELLFEQRTGDLPARSARQVTVYHNILNVIGDRMRKNTAASLILSGASEQGEQHGRERAESIKRYLVDVFGIDASRVETRGSLKPSIPSQQPGGSRELDLVVAEDQRVEIMSRPLDLLLPVRIVTVQDEPLDADLVLSTQGADQLLASWMVEITDAAGQKQTYGPFTGTQERIAGKRVLGDRPQGDFTVTLVGQTKAGQTIRKDERVRLVRDERQGEEMGRRFSILFEFDQSKTVATYERFLSEVVTPAIPDGANVVIHGHTDAIGEPSHNLKLSQERARETMSVLQRELAKAGKRRVRFDTYGFGEDERRAPFENRLPEERFYNRTVIIDIVP